MPCTAVLAHAGTAVINAVGRLALAFHLSGHVVWTELRPPQVDPPPTPFFRPPRSPLSAARCQDSGAEGRGHGELADQSVAAGRRQEPPGWPGKGKDGSGGPGELSGSCWPNSCRLLNSEPPQR